jgi:hypothetical protein
VIYVERAADIIFTLISLEVYHLLTAERGWSPADWEQWAGDTLAATILR